jgi:broad specificity phosphatase PhoE
MTRLILVRHCETINNVKCIISSAAPGPGITHTGSQQAIHLAESLAGTVLDAVYTSPLLRGLQTAEAISASSGQTPIVRAALRECGVGTLEGRGDEEAFARYHDVWDRWFYGEALDRSLGPHGENGFEALARLKDVVREVTAAHPDGTVVLVSHGGLLHFGLTLLCKDLDPDWTRSRTLPNAGMIIAEGDSIDLTCVEWCGEGVVASQIPNVRPR